MKTLKNYVAGALTTVMVSGCTGPALTASVLRANLNPNQSPKAEIAPSYKNANIASKEISIGGMHYMTDVYVVKSDTHLGKYSTMAKFTDVNGHIQFIDLGSVDTFGPAFSEAGLNSLGLTYRTTFIASPIEVAESTGNNWLSTLTIFSENTGEDVLGYGADFSLNRDPNSNDLIPTFIGSRVVSITNDSEKYAAAADALYGYLVEDDPAIPDTLTSFGS